ncbi:MAG TPA: hypothetical protein VE913_23140, partial [Longimicrobium sp.]|nr:hypothetical protein [Longimicrobium sp.]
MKVAKPEASVVAVAVPPSVPAPLAIAAVMTMPACATGFPLASRSWITGCRANVAPLAAVGHGGERRD